MSRLTVIPAYGRDYKNKKAVLTDYNANKDFVIQDISSQWDNKPINKQDCIRDNIKLAIRYNHNMHIVNT